MSKNEVIRLLFSIALIPVGALMVVLHSDTPAGTLLSHVGFALIVAGVLSTFHEAILRRFEHDEMAIAVADHVHAKLRAMPLTATGIRLVSPQRQGYAGYYTWVHGTGPSDLFFAGRSVLHRIDADIRGKTKESAETALLRRIQAGARVRVLLLDARSDLIPRVAREEGQSDRKLLSDLARSLGVCMRLHKLLGASTLPASANVRICVFDEIPYFAYHHADDLLIVGFYFASSLGYKSAAYEVVDPTTKDFFTEHFGSILRRAEDKYVLRVSPHSGQSELNQPLVDELLAVISSKVGATETERAVSNDG